MNHIDKFETGKPSLRIEDYFDRKQFNMISDFSEAFTLWSW